VKKHNHQARLYHAAKSAMVKHSINQGHRILIHGNNNLVKKSRQTDRIIREAIQIELHPNKMNREEGFSLDRACNPLIHTPKERKKFLSMNKHTLPTDLTSIFRTLKMKTVWFSNKILLYNVI
jgi:hypothetical protein